MDPDAACDTLIDELERPGWTPSDDDPPDEVEALAGWLARGGFAPRRARPLLIRILWLMQHSTTPLAVWRPWVVLCQRLAVVV